MRARSRNRFTFEPGDHMLVKGWLDEKRLDNKKSKGSSGNDLISPAAQRDQTAGERYK